MAHHALRAFVLAQSDTPFEFAAREEVRDV